MSRVIEAVERISTYYMDLLKKSYRYEADASYAFERTRDDVIDLLLPYALADNYWWEKEDLAMAYYQIQTKILVVKTNTFKKYYKKLMGKKFDQGDFLNPEKRQKIVEESKIQYAKKVGK